MVESILVFILKCFYLMLPAYFANMAPVMVKKINLFAFPIDFNKKLYGKPIFGKNKTLRGLVFGIIFAILVVYLQFLFYNNNILRNMAFFDYQQWILFGVLMGSGALVGDLTESFFKRRISIASGERFIPFDQIDFVIGALIFIIPVFDLTLRIFVVAILLSLILHILVNHLAFYLKIRNEKW